MEKKHTATTNSLFIAFHLRNSVNTAVEGGKLTELVYSLFPADRVEAVDLDLSKDFEAIFRVSRPVLDSAEENLIFFNCLRQLFEATEDYNPHFTQLYY